MSQAHAQQAAAPPWKGTLLQAALGLLLFPLLAAGGVVYGLLVLLPQLLQGGNVEVTYLRYKELVPEVGSPVMPVGLYLWLGAGVFCAVVLAVTLFVMVRLYNRTPSPGWIWGGVALSVVLIVPPIVAGFLLPSIPKIPGGVLWWYITGAVLAVSFVYVGWMYFRDSRGVGPLWASLLGLIRASVLTLPAFFFMQPAVGTFHEDYSRSKVLVLIDTSGSMVHHSDGLPDEAHPLDSLPTRQDKVLEFFRDEKINFLKRLEAKNPVEFHRFGHSRDAEYLHFSKANRSWTKKEWEDWLSNPNRDRTLHDPDRDPTAPAPGDLPSEFWTAWLKPDTAIQAPELWKGDQKDRFDRFLDMNRELLEKDPDSLNKTNFADSLLGLLDEQRDKALQGIILISDGHNTPGEVSPAAFNQLREHAQKAHIPIFVVGVGEERSQVRLDITELRVPQQIQPDDKFPAVVEVTGEGLSGEPVPVELEVTYVHKDKDGKEALLPIVVRESVDETSSSSVVKPKDPPKAQEVTLPSLRIMLKPAQPAKFDTGAPSRAEISFDIDAVVLAKASGVDLKQFDKVKKWEIAETAPDAELRFRAHIPRPAKEIIAAKEHVSDSEGLVVQKKPLRVLLFASAAAHEYQFVQAIMVRDMTKGRVKVSAYLQPPPGQMAPRQGVIQDALLLDKFPDQFDPGLADKAGNANDLSEYDVILAFDPDWSQLSKQQIGLIFGRDGPPGDDGKPTHVDGWVEKGGGFIYVAGPVNTVQLAGPREDEKARFGPILKDLPVVPTDIRLRPVARDTERAWPLDFKDSSAELLKFLKLQEETPDEKFQDDWKDFFGPVEPDHSVNRGFYNFYPVESARPNTLVAAYFGDPEAKAKDPQGNASLMPYLVVSNPGDASKRVVWIGWGEMWRLRQKNEAYLERFWTKLTRYAGDLHHGKIVKRITPNFGKVFKVGETVNMEARIEGRGGAPLADDAKIVVKITPPSAVVARITPEEADELKQLQGRKDLSPDEKRRKAQLEHMSKDEARQQKDLTDLQKDMFMKPKPQSEGWYQINPPFKAPVPGEYAMEVRVNETGDVVKHKFTVKPSNPELDDPRPKFDRLYETASYADRDIPGRMTPAEYADLVKRLERPKLEETQPDDKPRLFFTLANADLIPRCMAQIEKTEVGHDPAKVLWDEPVAAPVPVGVRWLPWWAAWGLGLGLAAGCVFGSIFNRERRGLGAGALSALVVLGGLVSAIGYFFTRRTGLIGWIICITAAVLIIGPLYMLPTFELGWYAFTVWVALMAVEWLIRKLLRLA